MAKSVSPIHTRTTRRNFAPKATTIDFPHGSEVPKKIHIKETTNPRGQRGAQ